MKTKLCLLLDTLALTLLLGISCTIQEACAEPLELRVMTFNIRNGLANDGANHWLLRQELVCDVITQCAPDVLGLQEAFRFQMDVFNKRLPQYAELGVGRDGDTKGEYSAILYLKERFDVDESGTFWLSDTPTKPSAHWGNHHRRICTWARLIDKKSARPFYVFNTHMDHQSQNAREKGIELIMKRIGERKHPDAFILMGDLNSAENNPVIAYLKGTGKLSASNPTALVDTFRVLHPDEKIVGTGCRFTGYNDGPKIDYIFVTPDTRTLEATIVRTNRDGRYPSDHYPVTARLKLNEDNSVSEKSKEESYNE